MKEWHKTVILLALLALGVSALLYGRYALSHQLTDQFQPTTTVEPTVPVTSK